MSSLRSLRPGEKTGLQTSNIVGFHHAKSDCSFQIKSELLQFLQHHRIAARGNA